MSEESVAEKYEHAGCVIKIMWDPEPLNPRTEWDHETVMFCDHGRYQLGDEDTGIDTSECNSWADVANVLRKEHKARIMLPLFLIDHSGISMRAGRDFSDCDPGHWDSGQVGFIFQTAEKIREQFCVKRITKDIEERAIEGLRLEVEEYDSYLTGDCYGYVVENANGDRVGSCWGFLGYDTLKEVKSEANAEAEYEFEQQKKRNGEALMQKTLQETMA